MATVNFFADIDTLPSQDTISSFDGAFGPVYGSEDNNYRTTAMFKKNTPVKAYAITKGEVIIIPASSTTVNIVLKPSNDVNLPGIPKVKYFIYRGILLSDFFVNGEIAPKNDTTNNAIIAALYKADEKLSTSNNQSTENQDKFKTVFYTLYALTQTEANLTILDHLFVKEEYYFSIVQSGDFIGNFTGSNVSYGFEILLEENGFDPTVALAKLNENIIDISSLSGAAKEVEKLEVLNYIDPAAYFGLFTHEGFEVSKKKGSPIYDNFVSKFQTKNRVYIDIRNKYGLPIDIDYATNVLNEIKVTTDNSSALSSVAKPYRNYLGNTSVWPVYIIDTGFTNITEPKSNYRYYVIKLSLLKGDVNNTTPLIHFITRHFKESWPIKANATYLSGQKYSKLTYDSANPTWTKDVEIATFASSGTGKPAVAAYIRLEYTQYINEDYIKDQVINYKLHEIDTVALFNQLSPRLATLPASIEITKDNGNIIVQSQGDSFYSIARNMAYEAVRGIAVDQVGEVLYCYRSSGAIKADNLKTTWEPETTDLMSGLTYNVASCFSFYEYLETNGIYIGVNPVTGDGITSGTYSNKVLTHNFYKKNKNVIGTHIVQFNNGTEDVKCIEVRVNDPLLIKGLQGNSPAEQFVSMAYTTTQKDIIKQIIEDTNIFATKRFIYVSQTNTSPITPTPSGQRKAWQTKMNLAGLKYISNRLELTNDVEIPMDFYSVDGLTFVTTEYAEAVSQIGTPPVITNHIVPDFVGSNIPFAEANGFAANTLSEIRTKLTAIAGTNYARARILYGEIRDYMYDCDLDNLTWEMAFRLPFYLEDSRYVPYSDNVPITYDRIGINTSVSKRVSTPFIDYFKTDGFDSWFDFANELRNLQLATNQYGALGQLRRNGFAVDIDGTSPQTYIDLGFEEGFLNNNPEFRNVHAYHARIWEDENRNDNYEDECHFPANSSFRGISAELEDYTSSQLTKLRDVTPNGVISNPTRQELASYASSPNNSKFVFTEDIHTSDETYHVILVAGSDDPPVEEIADDLTLAQQHEIVVGNPNKGHYNFRTRFIYKPQNSSTFYIWNNAVQANNSSVTGGFGFDFGQQDRNTFENHTPYSTRGDINYLVKLLNLDYNLYNTDNEIIYNTDPQTTYQDVLNGITSAGVTVAQLRTKYSVPNSYTYYTLSGVPLTVTVNVATDIDALTYISRDPDWIHILGEHITRISGGTADDNYDKNNIVNMVLGAQGWDSGAREIFDVFRDVLWRSLRFPRLKAICLTPKFMNLEYEKKAVKKIAIDGNDPVLKIYPDPTNTTTFYFNGAPEFMNEVEKMIVLSLAYNGSPENMAVNKGDRFKKKVSRILAHAINTHNIRWLRYCLKERNLTVYSGRLPKLQEHVAKNSYVKHYRRSIYE